MHYPIYSMLSLWLFFSFHKELTLAGDTRNLIDALISYALKCRACPVCSTGHDYISNVHLHFCCSATGSVDRSLACCHSLPSKAMHMSASLWQMELEGALRHSPNAMQVSNLCTFITTAMAVMSCSSSL